MTRESNRHDVRIEHAADRLLAAIDRCRAPVCVGLDPVIEKIPREMQAAASEIDRFRVETAIRFFCIGVLDAVKDIVPCVKLQSACFERLVRGSNVLQALVDQAHLRGMEVILDAKRGDIGVSAEHYAAAAFDKSAAIFSAPDWITINSYLGEDGIRPFLRRSHGAFALVRTSNPGGDAIQSLALSDGRTVAEAVAQIIASIGDEYLGERGYSSLGAVVGATKRSEAARLRALMPRQIFLVPGFGAQGAGVDDVLPCFNPDGTGAIITASRSIIYAFKPDDPDWTSSVRLAAQTFADEVGRAVGMR
jgi:orotidine-5'-phosphate decarboxylase